MKSAISIKGIIMILLLNKLNVRTNIGILFISMSRIKACKKLMWTNQDQGPYPVKTAETHLQHVNLVLPWKQVC